MVPLCSACPLLHAPMQGAHSFYPLVRSVQGSRAPSKRRSPDEVQVRTECKARKADGACCNSIRRPLVAHFGCSAESLSTLRSHHEPPLRVPLHAPLYPPVRPTQAARAQKDKAKASWEVKAREAKEKETGCGTLEQLRQFIAANNDELPNIKRRGLWHRPDSEPLSVGPKSASDVERQKMDEKRAKRLEALSGSDWRSYWQWPQWQNEQEIFK